MEEISRLVSGHNYTMWRKSNVYNVLTILYIVTVVELNYVDKTLKKVNNMHLLSQNLCILSFYISLLFFFICFQFLFVSVPR